MITRPEAATEENLADELTQIAERVGVRDLDEALYFPRYFQVETVRVCNARCPFCAIDKWDKSTPVMRDALYEKIVDEMANFAHWVRKVSIQRAGEPLLDKKIVKRVRMMKEAGIDGITMSTNASMLTEEKGAALLEAGVQEMMISIDAVDRENYEKSRVGLDYDTVMANIRSFFRVREKVNPEALIRVRGVLLFDVQTDEGKRQLQHWEHFWDDLKKPQDRIYMKQPHNWGNQHEAGKNKSYGDIFHPCVLPWSTMHITAMGTVPLCPQDYDAEANLGDINTHSIQEVWQGAMWDRIRTLHATGKRNEINFCRGCKLFDLDFSLEKKQREANTLELHEG